ncbi:MAG: HD domain-containing protein [Saprospiraceae bacterium]
MNKKKIFNDPVYGFINIPYNIIFDLIEHPYFQRLRRIKQLGLTDHVYPGALHTRFHHALGAMHLMTQAIEVLRSKGVSISTKEAKAVSIGILLHDIGHGPFSHTLEKTLVNVHHEELSLFFMEALNKEFNGKLTLAIQIFKNEYPKQFLHQLISGQLDMDRMDYLNRDSFFTGVYEGVIGYDRIIKMLAVKDGNLVVESKGIYSIEKFLMARRLMYWQVYLHKTVVASEQMLVKVLKRAKELADKKKKLDISESLAYFLYHCPEKPFRKKEKRALLNHFSLLDDFDIYSALKNFTRSDDFLLSYYAKSLLNRNLFKIEFSNEPYESDYLEEIRYKIAQKFPIDLQSVQQLIISGKESNNVYTISKEEILILFKGGKVLPMSEISDFGLQSKNITKYYLCYPKNIF